MHQPAVDLFQLLVQAGAVPGQDFSCDANQQAYHLNARCYHLLQQAYPDIDWHEVLGAPYESLEAAIAALHEYLGCPFIDNLAERMATRLSQLSDRAAAGYVQCILAGVESATGIALYPFLAARLDMTGKARLEWLARQETVELVGSEWLQDLVEAAGGHPSDCGLQGDEVLLTEAGWQRLSCVWQGQDMLNVAPVPR